MRTGMVVDFRLPGKLYAADGRYEHYDAGDSRPIQLTSDTAYGAKGWNRPGMWKSFGAHTADGWGNGHRGLEDSPFGSFMVHTTNPNRVALYHNNAKAVFMSR